MADDNDVQRIYESLDTLNNRVDSLEQKGLSARVRKLEEAQKIIITFCASLEPLISVLKKFKIFEFNFNDE
jgi:hypothetical protein